MPTTKKVTISHASHTDHRILRRPPDQNGTPQKPKLVVWRDPPEQFRQRNRGLSELMLSPEENEDLWREGASLLLSLDPKQLSTDADVVTSLENFYLRTGDLPKALEFGSRSVDLNPRSSTAALTFARVLEASGSASEAEEQYLRAINIDPSLKEAYGRLAVHYARQGRFDEAKNILDRYLRWNPNEIFFHDLERRFSAQQGIAPPQ
jgi:tetratricopeptide (TPR) repeat protein